MRVVFDAGVVLAGAGWRNESWHCLVLAAKRIALPYATDETLDELVRVAKELQEEGAFQRRDPWPVLHWYLDFVRRVTPHPLRKRMSRDWKDDPYFASKLTEITASSGVNRCSDGGVGSSSAFRAAFSASTLVSSAHVGFGAIGSTGSVWEM